MSTPICSSYINTHIGDLPEGIAILPYKQYDKYASLTIEDVIYDTSDTDNHPVFFHFKVDCSGSMNNPCKDKKCKMEHICNVLVNILKYFVEHTERVFYVNLATFNSNIYNIIDTVQVTAENVDDLISRINNIIPDDGTNIEKALLHSSKVMDEYHNKNPSHYICSLFLTDGESTEGNCNNEALAALVPPNFSTHYIAFGIEHNEVLMNKLGHANVISNNWLVTVLETAGAVYGEILNYELYKSLSNVIINVENGVIYDYEVGSFVDKLYVKDLIYQAKKTYHILHNESIPVVATISGNITKNGNNYSQQSVITGDTNLTTSIFRFKTQQMLYEVRTCAPYPDHYSFPTQRLTRQLAISNMTRNNSYSVSHWERDFNTPPPLQYPDDDDDEEEDDNKTPTPVTNMNANVIANTIPYDLFPLSPRNVVSPNAVTPILSFDNYADDAISSLTQAHSPIVNSTGMHPTTPILISPNHSPRRTYNEIKTQLYSLLSIMKIYVDTHNLQDDVYMKHLMDDVYIAYRVIGTRRQLLYSAARETSQGRQQSCNVAVNEEDLFIDTLGDNYNLSQNVSTAYTTPTCARMMRACSHGTSTIIDDSV
jgi:hypothetical protein